jgi:ParB family chromosome partitioning protein
VATVPLDSISRNPRQPRAHFDPAELTGLADSIREHGVIQPLIVTPGLEPDTFVLIAGERRWLAAKEAGLERLPVLVRGASDQQRLELALIENVQRADLSPLEEAEAYHQLAEDFHLSHEEISGRVGKSRVAITNTLRLLKLPAAVQSALANGRISEGHARALLALPTPQAQEVALDTILKNDLNVRQTEELVRRLSGQRPEPKPRRRSLSPEYASLEERLRSRLGTRVRLDHRGKGGTVTIHYYSEEELNSLVDQLLGKE